MRQFGRPRVLICDDEPAVRTVCDRALKLAGYDPASATGGHEALAMLARDTYDALVLDVRMPDMDGPEVMEHLREHDTDLPVVVISGYSAFEDAIRCLRSGAVDFVKKPFDVETIVRAVDRAVASTHLKADSAVLAASQSIFSSLDPWEIGRRVLRVARSLLRADTAALILAEAPGPIESEPGKTLRAGADDEISVVSPPSATFLARLLDLRDPVVFTREHQGDAEILEELGGAYTAMVHRLMRGERPAGLLVATRSPAARGFGERDLRRATLVAGHAALALDNARLHVATETQAHDLARAFDRLVVAERIATVARLSSSLGHEISNPACAMLANLEVARDAVAKGRTKAVDEALARAQVACNAILDVCNALRPLGAHAARKLELVDLRRVIDGAAMLATYEIRPRASLRVFVPDDLPLVPGDPAKLGQVFLNLLLNAAQAITPGSPEMNEITVRAQADDGTVVASVADTGVGVAPTLLPELFQPSVTTRAASEGHGMGLAVCRWIIEECGGAIRALPDVPRGAIFEVRLPVRSLTSP